MIGGKLLYNVVMVSAGITTHSFSLFLTCNWHDPSFSYEAWCCDLNTFQDDHHDRSNHDRSPYKDTKIHSYRRHSPHCAFYNWKCVSLNSPRLFLSPPCPAHRRSAVYSAFLLYCVWPFAFLESKYRQNNAVFVSF